MLLGNEKCGYRRLARVMLEAGGTPFDYVDISGLSEGEDERLAEALGVKWVPVLSRVAGGRVVDVKHFAGEEDRDIALVRSIA